MEKVLRFIHDPSSQITQTLNFLLFRINSFKNVLFMALLVIVYVIKTLFSPESVRETVKGEKGCVSVCFKGFL